jgi:outer membrane immunogenic protein
LPKKSGNRRLCLACHIRENSIGTTDFALANLSKAWQLAREIGKLHSSGDVMKRLLVAGAALTALIGTPALAADMALKAPPPPAPVWSWTGCYIGGSVGGAWARTRITDVGNAAGAAFASAGTAGQTFNVDHSGVIGGGQLGCDWQSSNFVWGIEGEVGGMGIRSSALDPGTVSNTRVGIDSGVFGDITGRLGITSGPALFYARGGVAFYGGREAFSTMSAAFISNSDVGTFTGWTAGAGIEYHLQGPWSAKVEYQHFGFGSQTFSVLATGGTFPFRERLDVDAVSAGINYRFGWMGH